MSCLPDNDTLFYWLSQYGTIFLFCSLALGIILLPVPEETLLVITGAFIGNAKLSFLPTFLAACGGSITGITGSYLIGRTAGSYLVHKFGSKVGIGEKQLNRAHAWFEKFGTWALFIGYFIPGLRHFTGLSAGITELEYNRFALYAYSGAIIWVSLFISIGYFTGNYCLTLVQNLEFSIEHVAIGLILLSLIGCLIYLKKKML